MSPKVFTVYVDGAVSGQNAPTGVGVVLLDDANRILRQEGFPAGIGTNQSAEILAAVAGLRLIPPGSIVTVVSDSQYVIKTMTDGWSRRANQAHWQLLDAEVALMQRIEWRHIRGHSGDQHNEAADRLAVLAKAKGFDARLPVRAAVSTQPTVAPVSPQPVQPPHDPDIERLLQTAITTIANLAIGRDADPNLRLAVMTARRADAEAAVLRRRAQDFVAAG